MSNGQDCAWLDNVIFPPATTITHVGRTITTAPALYPNPNHGQFHINLPEENCLVTVYNSLGQQVYRIENVSGTTTLNLEMLQNGLYLLNVISGEHHSTQPFIKE